VHGVAVAGATFPVPIWHEYMAAALWHHKVLGFELPKKYPSYRSITRGNYGSLGSYYTTPSYTPTYTPTTTAATTTTVPRPATTTQAPAKPAPTTTKATTPPPAPTRTTTPPPPPGTTANPGIAQ
jgi:membrane carboxypeptidase/penicillin-binding protein